MKNNLRGKIREFIASEEGKVGVKGPLTLGVATGSVLLAQAIVGAPEAAAQPLNNGEYRLRRSGLELNPFHFRRISLETSIFFPIFFLKSCIVKREYLFSVREGTGNCQNRVCGKPGR